ncbi:MAG: hypothetical protein JNN26_27310 [Candidatus Obscuribacter sp.]|nr:hypothetical protein [Candidatus Obscuribacter sp.]
MEISHKFTQPIQTQQQQQNYNNNNNNNNNKFYSFIPKQYIALHPNQPHQPHQSNQQTAQEIDMVKIDSPSIKRYANQQPSSPLLRQTMPSQQSNFMNLRKRIQSNANNNFNLNLTPVRSNHNITTGGTYLLENI